MDLVEVFYRHGEETALKVLQERLKKAKADKNREDMIKILAWLGYYHMLCMKHDIAIKFFRSAMKIILEGRYKADIYYGLGSIFYTLRDYKKAKNYLVNSIYESNKLSKENPYYLYIAYNAYVTLGSIYLQTNEPLKFRKVMSTLVRLLKKIKNLNSDLYEVCLALLYDLVAEKLLLENSYIPGIERLYLSSIKIYKSLHGTFKYFSKTCNSYMNIIYLYLSRRELQKAEKILDELESYVSIIKSKIPIMFKSWEICVLYLRALLMWLRNEVGEIRKMIERILGAIDDLSYPVKSWYLVASIYLFVARLYLFTRNTVGARDVLEKAKMFTKQANTPLNIEYFDIARSIVEFLLVEGRINDAKSLCDDLLSQIVIYKNLNYALGRVMIALIYAQSAVVYLEFGDINAAMDLAEKSLRSLENVPYLNRDVFFTYTILGRLYHMLMIYPKAKELLEKGLKVYNAIRNNIYINPAIIISHMITLSATYAALGNVRSTKSALDKASEILELYGNDPTYESNWALLQIAYARMYFCQGNFDRAAEYLIKGIKVMEKLYGQHGGYYWDLFDVYELGGMIFSEKREYDVALKYFNRAKDLVEKIAMEGNELYMSKLVEAYANIAVLHYAQNKYDDAISAFKKSLSLLKDLYRRNPEKYLSDILGIYKWLGKVNYDIGKYHDAIKYYSDSLLLLKSCKTKPPELIELEADMRFSKFLCHAQIKDFWYAESEAIEAISLYKKLINISPAKSKARLLAVYSLLSSLYVFEKSYFRAKLYLESALDILRPLFNANPDSHLESYVDLCIKLSDVYEKLYMFEESEKVCLELLSSIDDLSAKSAKIYPSFYVELYNRMGDLYYSWGKLQKAINSYSQVLGILNRLSMLDSDEKYICVDVLVKLAKIYRFMHALEDSERMLIKAKELLDKIDESNRKMINMCYILLNLGELYYQFKQYEEARKYLLKLMSINCEEYPASKYKVEGALLLSRISIEKGEYVESEKQILYAQEIFKRHTDELTGLFFDAKLWIALARLYYKWGKYELFKKYMDLCIADLRNPLIFRDNGQFVVPVVFVFADTMIDILSLYSEYMADLDINGSIESCSTAVNMLENYAFMVGNFDEYIEFMKDYNLLSMALINVLKRIKALRTGKNLEKMLSILIKLKNIKRIQRLTAMCCKKELVKVKRYGRKLLENAWRFTYVKPRGRESLKEELSIRMRRTMDKIANVILHTIDMMKNQLCAIYVPSTMAIRDSLHIFSFILDDNQIPTNNNRKPKKLFIVCIYKNRVECSSISIDVESICNILYSGSSNSVGLDILLKLLPEPVVAVLKSAIRNEERIYLYLEPPLIFLPWDLLSGGEIYSKVIRVILGRPPYQHNNACNIKNICIRARYPEVFVKSIEKDITLSRDIKNSEAAYIEVDIDISLDSLIYPQVLIKFRDDANKNNFLGEILKNKKSRQFLILNIRKIRYLENNIYVSTLIIYDICYAFMCAGYSTILLNMQDKCFENTRKLAIKILKSAISNHLEAINLDKIYENETNLEEICIPITLYNLHII